MLERYPNTFSSPARSATSDFLSQIVEDCTIVERIYSYADLLPRRYIRLCKLAIEPRDPYKGYVGIPSTKFRAAVLFTSLRKSTIHHDPPLSYQLEKASIPSTHFFSKLPMVRSPQNIHWEETPPRAWPIKTESILAPSPLFPSALAIDILLRQL
jgi:hypothetical protein